MRVVNKQGHKILESYKQIKFLKKIMNFLFIKGIILKNEVKRLKTVAALGSGTSYTVQCNVLNLIWVARHLLDFTAWAVKSYPSYHMS